MPTPVSTFAERTRDARKILVVDLGFLGDSVHLVPACWELKRNYPQAELHTLSATVGSEVLRMVPCVDQAWAYPLSNPSPPWWKHLDILRALRRERFEVALSFSGGDRPVYVTALCGARHTLAHNSGRKHFYNPWLVQHWVSQRSRELPVYEQRRQVLVAAGFTLEPTRFDLRLPPDAADWARQFADTPAIHLSPNASSPQKEWPLENWQEFIPKLAAATGCNLIATGDGSPRERQRLEALARSFPSSQLRVLPDRLPLPRLAALLQRCAVHVGADSGVTHLAGALGTPTVTAYREYEGRQEWQPPGSGHLQEVVQCACIRQTQPDCLAGQRANCLGRIPADALLRDVQNVLSRH